MTNGLRHRGPDGFGDWCDENVGVGLGHRRLAILDLSAEGHQPMESRCRRFVISFNGEIYNHAELRHDLRDTGSWRGHSDTEVMLRGISVWGLERALAKFVGMFAFALWDREERMLHLARDRLGEKPLYYGEVANAFTFASELKAITAVATGGLQINRAAVQALMQFGYIPAPLSIYAGVCKLPPAAYVSIHVGAEGSRSIGAVRRYWDLDSSEVLSRRAAYAQASDADLEAELHALLQRSVRDQMVADVPLGAFLSGGIDSSTIVALMQQVGSQRVRTYTIGFEEQDYNEADHAREVAEHLGTDHTELIVTARDALQVVPRLPEIYDEPFADSSQIPTFLVSRMTRAHVTVSLSGDGGDELFGGYPRYQFGARLWHNIARVPTWARGMASGALRGLSARSWDRILELALPSRYQGSVSGHRLHRFARLLGVSTFADMYVCLVSQWQPGDQLVLGQLPSVSLAEDASVRSAAVSHLHGMRRFDLDKYLPDDILVKVDRASMSVSLESRAPLLDHRIVEFAWALPERVLMRQGTGKWLMRRILDRYVPRRLVDRPKRGFGIPITHWLRHELRDWAASLLDEHRLRSQGFINSELVATMWREHQSGRHDRQAYLWNVLMFQAWLEQHSAQTTSVAAPLGVTT